MTVARTVNVTDAFGFNEPIFQLGFVQVPELGVALTKVYPEGNISFTTTFDATFGPKLVAVKVKVTFEP